MSATIKLEPIDDVVTEYLATFASCWSEATYRKYKAELRSLQAWLVVAGPPATTASLDFPTLRAHVDHLLSKPVTERIHPDASSPVVERARSLNTVNASMRAIRANRASSTEQSMLGIQVSLSGCGEFTTRRPCIEAHGDDRTVTCCVAGLRCSEQECGDSFRSQGTEWHAGVVRDSRVESSSG